MRREAARPEEAWPGALASKVVYGGTPICVRIYSQLMNFFEKKVEWDLRSTGAVEKQMQCGTVGQ